MGHLRLTALVGADLTKLTPAVLATLTNPAVLAIDQDPLGLQAVKVSESAKGLEVWSKPLAKSGDRAVLLLNRTAAAAYRHGRGRHDLGLLDSPAKIKDLWSVQDRGVVNAAYTATVPANDAVLLLVHGTEPKPSVYKPAAPPAGPLRFTHVASHAPIARVQITYANAGSATRFAELRVNAQTATRIAFPPTGSAPGAITIQALLDHAGPNNTLQFSTTAASKPAIQSIALQ